MFGVMAYRLQLYWPMRDIELAGWRPRFSLITSRVVTNPYADA